MPIDGPSLLGKLASGVRQIDAPRSQRELSELVASGDFETLLLKADAGELESGLGIKMGEGVNVQLDQEGESAVSAAVDRLAAAGAQDGLILMDGVALRLDVAQRQAVWSGPLESGTPIVGIDGIVSLLGKGGVRDKGKDEGSTLLRSLLGAPKLTA